MLLAMLVEPDGIWQMQLFHINQSEESSKITIMSDTTCGQFHKRPIKKHPTTAPTLHEWALSEVSEGA